MSTHLYKDPHTRTLVPHIVKHIFNGPDFNNDNAVWLIRAHASIECICVCLNDSLSILLQFRFQVEIVWQNKWKSERTTTYVAVWCLPNCWKTPSEIRLCFVGKLLVQNKYQLELFIVHIPVEAFAEVVHCRTWPHMKPECGMLCEWRSAQAHGTARRTG